MLLKGVETIIIVEMSAVSINVNNRPIKKEFDRKHVQ